MRNKAWLFTQDPHAHAQNTRVYTHTHTCTHIPMHAWQIHSVFCVLHFVAYITQNSPLNSPLGYEYVFSNGDKYPYLDFQIFQKI